MDHHIKKDLSNGQGQFLRDLAATLRTMILIVFQSILDATVTWYESLLMVLLYVVYIIFMV